MDFHDQEIRAAGGELDIRRCHHRPAIEMRRDLAGRVSAMPAIFLASSSPPTRPRFICRIEAAPVSRIRATPSWWPAARRRQWGSTCSARPGHVGGVFRRHRFLEPQRIIGLDPARHALGARHGELAVGAEQQIGAGADRLADCTAECLAAVQILQPRLVAVIDRVGTRWVELHGSEPLFDGLAPRPRPPDPDRRRRSACRVRDRRRPAAG